MKTQKVVEEIKECELICTNANQAIKDIDDKMETLNTQQEYQKGLRDAAYAILKRIKIIEKEGEN